MAYSNQSHYPNSTAGPSHSRRHPSTDDYGAYLGSANGFGQNTSNGYGGRFDDASDDDRASHLDLHDAMSAFDPPPPRDPSTSQPLQQATPPRLSSSTSALSLSAERRLPSSLSATLRGKRAPAPAALDLSPRSERTMAEQEPRVSSKCDENAECSAFLDLYLNRLDLPTNRSILPRSHLPLTLRSILLRLCQPLEGRWEINYWQNHSKNLEPVSIHTTTALHLPVLSCRLKCHKTCPSPQDRLTLSILPISIETTSSAWANCQLHGGTLRHCERTLHQALCHRYQRTSGLKDLQV